MTKWMIWKEYNSKKPSLPYGSESEAQTSQLYYFLSCPETNLYMFLSLLQNSEQLGLVVAFTHLLKFW